MKRGTQSNALLVFMRFPRLGKVKTRLARSLGDDKATEFYRLCSHAVLDEILQLSREVEKYIYLAEPINEYEMKQLAGLEFKISIQEGKNLGQRLCGAFSKAFDSGLRKVAIVASDVPDLSTRIMEQAISSLDNTDVVIGPCYDGGYYLIGMKELHVELFNGISWGTNRVYRQTLDAAKENGLTVGQLPILIDIDTEANLRRWSQLDGHKKQDLMDFIQAIHL